MKVTGMTDEEDKTVMSGNSSSGRTPRAPTATIEEVDENGGDEEEEDCLTMLSGEKLKGTDTPLIGKGTACTLVRVSTFGSSLNQPTANSRHDSTRSRFRSGALGRKLRRRVVLKNGECNVFQSHISQRSLRYLQDIFTTLVDTQWRWTLLVFALSFILSWLGFATIWWLIAFTHGDLEEHKDSDWKDCVIGLHNFASCFLFSIETQHTIGYGSRSTTEECPEAIFIMCLQSITGVMIQAFMVGIVFAKMSRPKQRTQTLLFSRNAVICQRDGNLCLMFRVGDMRKSHIIGASIRAQLIKTCQTQEGEVLSQSQCELEVGTDYGGADLFFIWPMTVVHRINSNSPLYRISASELIEKERSERFEIVVMLEGTIESTGQTTQARSSYLPCEILWGHRFEPLVSYNKDRQAYEVNYNKFNNTYNVDTPLCSAKELEEFYRIQQGLRQHVDLASRISRSSTASTLPSSAVQSPDQTATMNPFNVMRHSVISNSYSLVQLNDTNPFLNGKTTARNGIVSNNQQIIQPPDQTAVFGSKHTQRSNVISNSQPVIPEQTLLLSPSNLALKSSASSNSSESPSSSNLNNMKLYYKTPPLTPSSPKAFNLEEEIIKQNIQNLILKQLPNDFNGGIPFIDNTPQISNEELNRRLEKGQSYVCIAMDVDNVVSSIKESSL